MTIAFPGLPVHGLTLKTPAAGAAVDIDDDTPGRQVEA